VTRAMSDKTRIGELNALIDRQQREHKAALAAKDAEIAALKAFSDAQVERLKQRGTDYAIAVTERDAAREELAAFRAWSDRAVGEARSVRDANQQQRDAARAEVARLTAEVAGARQDLGLTRMAYESEKRLRDAAHAALTERDAENTRLREALATKDSLLAMASTHIEPERDLAPSAPAVEDSDAK